jgi:hypothetical protein
MNPLKNTFLILKGKIIIWKHIKNKRTPKTTLPPLRKYSTHPEPRAKSDKGKAELFAEHLPEFFSPHNNDQDRKLEQDPFNCKNALKYLL